MSAGITETDTVVATGKATWHGLDERSDHHMTPDEAFGIALDWTVAKVPVLAQVNGHSEAIPGYAATIREDTKAVLGVTKEKYQIIQNETVKDFMSALVDGGAVCETAGSLFGGKQVWMLAKVSEDIILPRNGGTILPYLLVLSSHDGTKALTARMTPIRVECANTVDMAIAGNKSAITIKHTALADPAKRIVEAQEALGFSYKWYDAFTASATKLAAAKMSAKSLDAFVTALFPNRKGEDEEDATRTVNRRNAVLALAKNAENLEAVRGTKWAAYNAVAEFADYGITYRQTAAATREDNRTASILGGSALALKERALALLN
jgi:phage/plasmid-like protein (TIGR03299 family)